MRLRNEWVMYLGVFLLFAGIVLVADRASGPLIAVFFVGAAALLLIMLAGLRRPSPILLVGERGAAPVEPLENALDEAGFEIWRCAGPSNRPCPVFLGERCPLSERPAAAVICRDAKDTSPIAPCGRALLVPALAVETGSARELEFAGRDARIGWDRGPDEVIHVLENLLVA